MLDHDQRFKLLLQEFFGEFLELFFPRQAARFDFSKIEWLDKEVFADPPQGERGYLDLVAQLPTREPVAGQRIGEVDSLLALVHVEIEHAESAQQLRSRMFQYYEQLRRRHGLPVLPIVLYLRVGLDGIGQDAYEEFFWELRTLTFEYLYVGLPALNAEEYASKENLLGIALSALMRAPAERKARLAAQGLNRVVKSKESSWRKFLLGDCVIAHTVTDENAKQELTAMLEHEEYREVRAMNATWFDQGMLLGRKEGRAEGWEEGKQSGQRDLILTMLEERFDLVNDEIYTKVNAWPSDRLEELARGILKGKSLRELGLSS
jgi:Domain of unknown function (DUF4351)